MNTTLAKEYPFDHQVSYKKLNINRLVHSASDVIAPYGPIHHFAARNPWAGMEHRSFEKTARLLKEISEINMYPNHSLVQSANDSDEINLDYLKSSLRAWLDGQSFGVPREAAEQFCWSALLKDKQGIEQDELKSVRRLAQKLNMFKSYFKKEHVVLTYSQRLKQFGNEKVLNNLNLYMIKWCKLYLDDAHTNWSMPNREEGFYHSWKKLSPLDSSLNWNIRKELGRLPSKPEDALREAFIKLDIPYEEIESYLKAHLLALPGWAGMMLWKSQQSRKNRTLVTEYLAIRLIMELAFMKPYLPLTKQTDAGNLEIEELMIAWIHWGSMPISAWNELSTKEQFARLTLAYRFDSITRSRLWLEAWEKTYEDQLKIEITRKHKAEIKAKAAVAQFAFCIDVRSEPFRRHLEQAGPFETIGTAGFFNLPIERCELGDRHSHYSLPVLFKPQFKVEESLPEKELKQYHRKLQTVNTPGHTFKTLKHNLLSSLVLPEISGPWLTLQTIARSFIPRSTGNVIRKAQEKVMGKPTTNLTLDREKVSETELQVGLIDDEKVSYALNALEMMGLTEHFAPLVVFCGHAQKSTNNPFASSLDCGACGGASSGFNARVLAQLCNLPIVRERLAIKGIVIPAYTVFAAAEHITTLDELRWIYLPELSNQAKKSFVQVQEILPQVSDVANKERLSLLPNTQKTIKNPRLEAQRFAEDWSEVRPEWGLARNAAFIIGERQLTEDCNLEGRVFLHNYSWEKDQNGELLDKIMNGPTIVAQGINLQYYASTVAPHYYGSGNKTLQTVTAGIGVMHGNASDLLIGLPLQSVRKSDQEAYHAPLRLLVVIQAPWSYVERMMNKNAQFREKVKNNWIRLACIDPEGKWKSWV